MSFNNLSETERKKILNRVKRLKAMADDSSSENEAMIAARRLHAMLGKYDLDLSELEGGEREVAEQEGPFHLNIRAAWADRIFYFVAKLYFCKSYMSVTRRPGKNPFVIIGKKSHRRLAFDIATRIIKNVQAESGRQLAHYEAVEGFALGKGPARSWKTDFCVAAADRITRRCLDIMEQAKRGELEDIEAGDGSKLPMMLPQYEQAERDNEAAMGDVRLTTRKDAKRNMNLTARQRGDQYGHKVRLNNGELKGQGQKQLGHIG